MNNIPINYSPIPGAPAASATPQDLPAGQTGSQFLQGIEGIFDAYNRNKMAQAQLQGQNLSNQGQAFSNQATEANYRLGMFGLSPQDINQNIGAAMQPQSYAPPADQGSLYGTPTQGQSVISGQSIPTDAKQNGMGPAPGILAMPQPQLQSPGQPQIGPQGSIGAPIGQPGQPQAGPQGNPQEGPVVSTLRGLLQMHGHTARLQAAQAEANLSKTGAESGKLGSEAAKTNLLVNLISGGNGDSGDTIKRLADQAQSGTVDPGLSDLGRGEDQSALRLALGLELSRRGANMTQLQASYDAKQAGAKEKATSTAAVQGGKGQVLGSAAGTLEDIMAQAKPLAAKFDASRWQAINSAFATGKSLANDPDANEFLGLMNEARGKYATVLAQGNGATDVEKQQALESIRPGLNEQGFNGMARAVSFAAHSTVKRVTGRGFNEPAAKTTTGNAQNWSGGATHVYPDGTKAQWNGSAWVKVQ